MTAYVFAGPTIAHEAVRALGDFVCLPPAAQGDIYRVTKAGARTIGLIDGTFEGAPAVWHKEILWALSQGIPVFGSASMGALRGAELCAFGMRGVGRIFEGYRDGTLEDDDEVAVLHGPAEVSYAALSEPLVNIRATLERAVAAGIVAAATGRAVETHAKRMFYKERTWQAVFAGVAASAELPAGEIAALRAWLPQGRVDRKAEDARAMLRAMAAWQRDDPPPAEADFDFEWTDAWETAVTVAPTVGLDPAGDSAAVPQDRLLDELRLDPEAYSSAKTAALARLLALREAERHGLTVEQPAVKAVFGRLREAHGLLRRAELDRWLAANDLPAEDFERLMEDEARLEAQAARVEPALDGPLIDHLRVTDRYARLAARARRKQAALSALGVPDPGPDDLDISPLQLKLWFFETQLGQALPDDLDAAARALGLADRTDLHRLLAREYLFSRGTDQGD